VPNPSITYDDDLVAEEPTPRWYHRVAQSGEHYTNRVLLIVALTALLALYFWPHMFITVRSGEVGVLFLRFAGGTQTDRVLGEGQKIIAPWDKLFIYNVRVQEAKHSLVVLSQEGLPVTLDLSIRYHPEMQLVGLLHNRVGPDYRDKIVVPEVESALRLTLGAYPVSAVYGSQRGVVQAAINESLEQVEQKFVKIDDVVIRKVELPETVRQSIEQKMLQRELAESYPYRMEVATREAERLRIEAGGLKDYNELINASLTPTVLQWAGIAATRELAKSANAKTVVVGSQGTGGLPLILGQ